ncbi:glycosyltransferase family 4 protein [Rhabdothermincola salaria]|uniref:glycosyltransferase family 4 protein n=1 Tax=Rhabdothermincola salaria TaxID=2903142 RepID=UPI001E628750|nr:glycosyltransferase family 4 protein [Rhabdothermincola salaria]MCD9622733.1 glycosyltransferase family 4 protein [Rhabdothermincola salaria]
MRVVHVVCTDAFAGVERYVTYVAARQAELGHQVTVLGGAHLPMTAALDGAGAEWAPASTTAAAARALGSQRPDVVHAHMTAAEVAAVASRPRHHAPVVATVHFAQERGAGRRRARLYRLLPRFLAAQVAISAFVAERAGLDLGDPRVHVVPNGVPWTQPPRPRRPVVLVAQRLEAEKDTATALRAWAASGLAEQGWHLDVVGDGAERPRLEALARSGGVEGSVRFAGFVGDVPRRLAEASIVVAPAPAEPFGLTVVEAMAAGTPVVAAAGGAHLETVGSAGVGGLFTPGSASEAATELRALADDEGRQASVGDALHQRWAEAFTIEGHVDALDAVYRRVGRDS